MTDGRGVAGLVERPGVTVTTSLRPLTPSVTAVAAVLGSSLFLASTTIIRGPLKPGPKPSDSRSYARRCVVDVGCEPSSGSPSSSWVAGTAIAPSPTTPSSSTAAGRRMTKLAQRVPMPGLAGTWEDFSGSSLLLRFPRFSPAGRIFRPAYPRSAGIMVSAIRTATTTVPAAARPILVSIGTPTTERPASAITTVRPAKTTAEPAVPVARPAASSRSRPSASSPRYRETMNRA
ncbi:hypothetical protein SALBM311S_04730 [Streptomyces alboniger]